MIKVLTIFGAGASYDSIDPDLGNIKDVRHRPPLTKDLFENKYPKNEILIKYHSLGALVADVTNELRLKPSTNLEELLDQVWENSQKKNNRKNQINELYLYLAHLFRECSNNYIGYGSNYERYIQFLEDHDINNVIVTFNYDTILEEAVKKVIKENYDDIDSYITNKHPIIKIHGSWNWSYDSSVITQNPIKVRFDQAGLITEKKAMGLPVLKSKKFVCPSRHTSFLKSSLSDINIILIIGWAGKEPHFFDFIKQSDLANSSFRLIIVNRNMDNIRKLEKLFLDNFPNASTLKLNDQGFSKFVNAGELDILLS